MMSFRGDRLARSRLPLGTVWLLESLAESRGRREMYQKQSPQLLEAMRELALVESAESSNRIEGVTVERTRLRPLVLGNARPRDGSEEKVVGYRKALSWIHAHHAKVAVEPATLLRLHALAQGGSSGDAGVWKLARNDIVEVHADGRRSIRFRPVEPADAPGAVEELCLAYRQVTDQGQVIPLLAVGCLVLDFLCIHPFRDGNGRVSRLLTLLALYHHGHEVGRYVSHERIVEESMETYYEALKTSSAGWHEGKHDVLPWFNFFLSTQRAAWGEFEQRAGRKRPARGSKAELVAHALASLPSPFGIADLERLCPSVSREMVRVVMNRWRKEGRLEVVARGRAARWRRLPS